MEPNQLEQLPPHLPQPLDDGACRHLKGTALPAVTLPCADGTQINMRTLPGIRTILFFYPMTGTPGQPLPTGWDSIAGARGCTPETCSFRDYYSELTELGIAVLGVSAQSPADQQEMVGRLHVPFPILSDADFVLADALRLPTFEVYGRRFIKRLTLMIEGMYIRHVFYPIFPPDAHAKEVLEWLRQTSCP